MGTPAYRVPRNSLPLWPNKNSGSNVTFPAVAGGSKVALVSARSTRGGKDGKKASNNSVGGCTCGALCWRRGECVSVWDGAPVPDHAVRELRKPDPLRRWSAESIRNRRDLGMGRARLR